jgi:hypothetical protein
MRGNTARHLFDHRKDDPVRFSIMARPQQSASGQPSPTSKSSRDYVLASSTSSYAASISQISRCRGRSQSRQAGHDKYAFLRAYLLHLVVSAYDLRLAS